MSDIALRACGTDRLVPVLRHVDAGKDDAGGWVDHFHLKDQIITTRWVPGSADLVTAERRLDYVAWRLLQKGFELFVDGFPVKIGRSLEMMERLVNPPLVLGSGYAIPDCRPGAVVEWRPLGRKERPLARLAGFEEGLKAL